jgi:hypothetical protein
LRIHPSTYEIELPREEYEILYQAINKFLKLPIETQHEVIDCDDDITNILSSAKEHDPEFVLVWQCCDQLYIEIYFLLLKYAPCFSTWIIRPMMTREASELKWAFELFEGKVDVTLSRSVI